MGRKRNFKSKKRFPRLELDRATRIAEKIIRIAFNKMARSRNLRYRNFNYDVYKTKAGWKVKLKFILLAEKLIQQNIDPALYIKVMCRYGKFKNVEWMPHPTWFSKDSTIEKFLWVYRKERKHYILDIDWKKELDGWSDLDIYSSIRDSGGIIKRVVEGQKIKTDEAIYAFAKELSPWFLAVYSKKHKKSFWNRWFEDYCKCSRFLNRHRHIWHVAKKALKRSFQTNSVSL